MVDREAIEERVGTLMVEAQRYQVWVRSEARPDTGWHNALMFRRDGIHGSTDASVAGLDWHVPPGIAQARAAALPEGEQVKLFLRAMRPRPPLV